MKKIICLVLIGMIFLVGCDTLGSFFGETERAKFVDYKKGISGLEIGSVEGLPPSELYEGGNFKIAAKLQNKGGYDLQRGTIEIAGFDRRYIVLNQEPKRDLPPIAGKSITGTEGGFYIEEFDGQVLRRLDKAREYEANYYLVATYDYRSEAKTDVCINTNLYSDLRLSEDSCKPEESISLGGQGAPISITKVEEVIVPEGDRTRIVFRLYLKNKGDGVLTSPITIEEVKLSNQRLSCEQSFLELEEEDNVVVCVAYENQPANYITPFYAAISYTYQIVEQNSFTIKGIKV
ncbi:MAG: hypothetical protein KAT77_02345 [Nanoarchaeota archaeon]|nr:hypothetical protein [Nanoarchaeota archaeon]